MENQPTPLDELLTTIETDAEEILAAGTQTVELPTEEEQWWPQLIDQFGSVEGIFARLGLDRGSLTRRWRWSVTVLDRGEGGKARSGPTGRSSSS